MPKPKRKDRKGRKQLAVWIPETTMKDLKAFAREHGETLAGAVDWCLRDSMDFLAKEKVMR